MTDPYYSDKLATLYHGDSLDVIDELLLDGLKVDAIIMDPPYASGTRKEAGKASSGAMLRGERWAANPIENDQMTTIGFVWLIRTIVGRLKPHLPAGASVLSFIDWRQWPNLVGALESCDLRIQGMVVWDKETMGLGYGFRRQHELICHASVGTPTINNKGIPDVLSHRRVSNDDHPSPKPVALMQLLIEAITVPGDMILDPFAGSGATLRAAKNLGRRSIGIETVDRHCVVAARSLARV
jgi:site-specific DNA-methyltransferase (adenine-specific)